MGAAYSLGLGTVDGVYPYPFMDPTVAGPGHVAATLGMMTILILLGEVFERAGQYQDALGAYEGAMTTLAAGDGPATQRPRLRSPPWLCCRNAIPRLPHGRSAPTCITVSLVRSIACCQDSRRYRRAREDMRTLNSCSACQILRTSAVLDQSPTPRPAR